MKLKKVLNVVLNEGRSREISFDRAFRTFIHRCSSYSERKTQIFRGIEGFNSNYGLVKPKQASKRRQSAHTRNYYTFIIDNSEKWSDYPDRGESIICSTDPSMAKSYGNLYLVIPFDGANIGVAPNIDIWRSFNVHLRSFNEIIRNISKKSYKYRTTAFEEPPESSYQEFKTYINKVDEVLENNNKYKDFSKYSFVERYLDRKSEFNGLWEYLEWVLNPYRNDFNRVNYSSNFDFPRDREVWTDSPCLLVKADKATDFFKGVNDHPSDENIDINYLENSYKKL